MIQAGFPVEVRLLRSTILPELNSAIYEPMAEGVAEVQLVPREGEELPPGEDVLTFSQHLACPNDGTSFDELAPRNFSFNSPYGACPKCDGLGTRYEVDPCSRECDDKSPNAVQRLNTSGSGVPSKPPMSWLQ